MGQFLKVSVRTPKGDLINFTFNKGEQAHQFAMSAESLGFKAVIDHDVFVLYENHNEAIDLLTTFYPIENATT